MEAWAYKPLYGPAQGTTQGGLYPSVSVTALVTAVASTRFPGGVNGGGQTAIQIANTTTAWAYVNFGDLDIGAVTAATVAASYPIAPGAVIVVRVADEVNGASVILGAATTGGTTVIFTRGVGL
jgi:hypothetical protein